MMLTLIEQEIDAADKQLIDFVAGRVTQLRQERTAAYDTLADIRQQMVQIPKVWASEVLLEQISTTNSKLAEEVSKLVESKNIAHNLEVIQSSPLDHAGIPPLPRPPYVVLITLLGAIAGGFLGTLVILFKEHMKGEPASRTNLRKLGLPVIAEIPKRPSRKVLKDLFLRLQHEVCTDKPAIILVLTGSGPDYTLAWTKKLQDNNIKVLRLETDDFHLAKEKSAEYDLIIAASHARADSIEAKIALSSFGQSVISIRDERLEDLEYLRNFTAKRVSIIVINT